MSKISELYVKVATDSNLQTKFQSILNDKDSTDTETIKKELISFAGELGFDVSWEEVEEFFRNLSGKDSQSLSEAELDLVAGGKEELDPFIVMSITTLGSGCIVVSIINGLDNCQL